jgi:hypothetical protein
VLDRQRLGAGQIGDRACDLEHPFVSSGRQSKAGHGGCEKALGFGGERAKAPNLARAHRGIDSDRRRTEPLALPLACRAHARANRVRGIAGERHLEVRRCERGELDVQIDAVEERAGEAAEISVPLGGGADTEVEGRAAPPAAVPSVGRVKRVCDFVVVSSRGFLGV